MKIAGRDADAIALYGDTRWAMGQFEESEALFREALALQPALPRALHGMARSLAARSRLEEALDTAQAALRIAPRDAEFHHTVGSIYERLHQYEEAANAFTSYVNLLPNKDRSAKAAWSRAEIRFLRAFGTRVPLEVDPAAVDGLHTMPFKVVDEKIIVRGRVNRGPEMDFALDTGSEQTVIARETASRLGVRAIANTLSAGVGDLGVRELELARLDQLEFGTLRSGMFRPSSRTRRCAGCRRRKPRASPLALGLSVIIDYERQRSRLDAGFPPRRWTSSSRPAPSTGSGGRTGRRRTGELHSRYWRPGDLDQYSIRRARCSGPLPDIFHQGLRLVGMGQDAFLMPAVDLSFGRFDLPTTRWSC